MSEPGLRRAIEAPASRAGLVFEDGLVNRIIADARMSTGPLPLVAHVLQKLYAQRKGRTLLERAYTAINGVGGALAQSADAIVETFNEDEQARAKGLLLRLVKIGRGGEDTRQVVSRDEAITAAGGGRIAERVLARLSGARGAKPGGASLAVVRLVVVDDQRVDLVHETLIQRWGNFQRWINGARPALELRDDVEEAARIWEVSGAAEDGLPKGALLARFLTVKRSTLLTKAQAYLKRAEEVEQRTTEERRAEQKRRARLQRRATLGIAGFLVLLLVAFWQVAAQRSRAREKEADVLMERARQADEQNNFARAGVWYALGRSLLGESARAEWGLRLGRARALQWRRVLDEQQASVTMLGFTPDGMMLLVGGSDGRINVWDVATGEWQLSFNVGEPPQAMGVLRPGANLGRGGALFVAAGHEIRVLDAETGEEVPQLRMTHDKLISNIAVHPDLPYIAAYGAGLILMFNQWPELAPRTLETTTAGMVFRRGERALSIVCPGTSYVRKWDPEGEPPESCPKSDSRPIIAREHVIIDPTGEQAFRFYTGRDEKIAGTMLTLDGRASGSIDGHSRNILAAAFSPDGSVLATCGRDRTLRLWDAVSRKNLITADVDCGSDVAVSSQGASVAVVTSSGRIELWRISHVPPLQQSRPQIRGFVSPDAKWILTLAESPVADGQSRQSGLQRFAAMLWDLESGAVRSLFARVSGQFSFTGSVVRFSHDTRFLAIRVSGSAAVHVYDTVFDRMIEAFEVTSAESDVTSFDVSSKSESMALGRRDGSVVIKTLGGSVHTVISTGSEILQVALSSDGRYLVSRDGTNVRIHRVDVATTPILVAKVPQPDAPRDATRSDLDVSFDFTGRFVQIAQIHGWDLYDLKEERLAASLRPPADAPVLPLVDVDSSLIMLSERVLRSRGVPFTIDTERLRVFSGYSDGSVQSLSLMDGTVQWKVALGSTRPDVLAITPDGGSLAVGCDDATIRILATGSGEEQFLLEDHEMPVVGLAFSPDGRNLVSIGQEQRAIRIWDVVERAPVASLDAHPVSDASFVRFAPDGRAIVWSNSRGDEAAIRWSPLGASADNAGSFLRDYALRMEGAVIQPLYAPPRKRPVPVPSP